MTREQREHILRAASTIAGDPDVLVIGSQSVLGSFADGDLPLEATSSMEADIAFFDDPADAKADQVDGAIGELSAFHETFGYYAQGVSVSTAVLPEGWRDRVIALTTPSTASGRGLCLDPHDCVISKLVAGRGEGPVFRRRAGPGRTHQPRHTRRPHWDSRCASPGNRKGHKLDRIESPRSRMTSR